jgi:hypothetical protein
MTMVMTAYMMFARMPVVRSGLAGSGSGAVIAGLRSRVGWSLLALRGENCGRENQSKYCNDLFHYVTPQKFGFPPGRIESHPPRKV